MWRFGYPNPVDYNDNELFCGGYAGKFDRKNAVINSGVRDPIDAHYLRLKIKVGAEVEKRFKKVVAHLQVLYYIYIYIKLYIYIYIVSLF